MQALVVSNIDPISVSKLFDVPLYVDKLSGLFLRKFINPVKEKCFLLNVFDL